MTPMPSPIFEPHLIWALLAVLALFGGRAPAFALAQRPLDVTAGGSPRGGTALGLSLRLAIHPASLPDRLAMRVGGRRARR